MVLVAGAGSGLGTALVDLLASSGCLAVAVARRPAPLEALRARGLRQGWSCETEVADLSDGPAVSALVQRLRDGHGHLDGVAILAGRWVAGSAQLHELTDEQWAAGLAENLQAPFVVARAVLPHFIAQRQGVIVLVSASEPVRLSGTAAYAAAKAGTVELGRKMAHDYRPHGIRVNVVLPGTMEHDIPAERAGPPAGPPGLRNDVGSGAWQVARIVRFLLSEQAEWVSGAVVPVDGGRSTGGAESPAG